MELSRITIGNPPDWDNIEADLKPKHYKQGGIPCPTLSDHILDCSNYIVPRGERIMPTRLTNKDYINKLLSGK